MHIPGGVFVGYRELPPVGGGPSATLPPMIMPVGDSIKPWELPFLPHLPYDYRVFRGKAGDDFPAEFVLIDPESDFKSTAVEINVRKSEAQIVYTVDGISAEPLVVLSGHNVQITSARGFMIRTNVPGDDCYYQLIFYR